jgi:hypothetical protein
MPLLRGQFKQSWIRSLKSPVGSPRLRQYVFNLEAVIFKYGWFRAQIFVLELLVDSS